MPSFYVGQKVLVEIAGKKYKAEVDIVIPGGEICVVPTEGPKKGQEVWVAPSRLTPTK